MTIGEGWTLAGYLVGLIVWVWFAYRRRLATEGMAFVAAWGFIAAIFCAKLSQLVAQGWPVRIPFWAVAEPEAGGRALLGGVIGGWIGVELAKRRLGIVRSTGDFFALALPAGEAIGRIGCFYNGCCYGTESRLPWAVHQHGAWRHPAQLYSSVVALTIFLVLLGIELLGELKREGDLFRLYLVLFGTSRFLLEFVRWRESLVLGLSPMQWFCLDLIVVGCVGLWRSQRLENGVAPTHDQA
jgi:phosphatidylglycerol:prolipoprotein diacylglycerol transferase